MLTISAQLTLLSPCEVWLEGLRDDPAHRGKGVAEANEESPHIARKQGFQEVARFIYVEGRVRHEVPPPGVAPVNGVEPAWAVTRAS